jgi:hypothetical protein
VLKWPLRAPPLAGLRQPSHQIVGKTTRYDVFMTAVRTRTIDAETTVVSRGATSALE